MCSDHPKFGAPLQTISVKQMRRLQRLTSRIGAGTEVQRSEIAATANFGGE
jgi:hypothetical protein